MSTYARYSANNYLALVTSSCSYFDYLSTRWIMVREEGDGRNEGKFVELYDVLKNSVNNID